MANLLKVIIIVAVMAGAAYGGLEVSRRTAASAEVAAAAESKSSSAGGSRGSSGGTLAVDVIEVRNEPLDYKIPATGTLTAQESVNVSSEQSRRLVEVVASEGTEVKAGDVLFRLDTSELKARLKELEARVEQAKREAVRRSSLLKDNAVAQSDYDAAATEVRILEAQIEQVQNDIAKAEIRAPFSGRVGLKRVSVGAWVTPDLVLTTLQDTKSVNVDFKVPERYAGAVKLGGKFRFRAEGMGEWQEGTIIAIEPAIDQATRSLIVRGRAPNADGNLVPGAFASVEMTIDTLPTGLLIPSEAVIPSPKGHSVFVVEAGKAAPRNVELGTRTPDKVQVISGLKEGDKVIVTNLLRVRPGAGVEARTAN